MDDISNVPVLTADFRRVYARIGAEWQSPRYDRSASVYVRSGPDLVPEVEDLAAELEAARTGWSVQLDAPSRPAGDPTNAVA